jgi:hypothetical protein
MSSAVNCVAFHPIKLETVFATSSNIIYEFDLRRPEVILKQCEFQSDSKLCEDDINCLSIHHTGQYLAAADDSGYVDSLYSYESFTLPHLTILREIFMMYTCNIYYIDYYIIENYCLFDNKIIYFVYIFVHLTYVSLFNPQKSKNIGY